MRSAPDRICGWARKIVRDSDPFSPQLIFDSLLPLDLPERRATMASSSFTSRGYSFQSSSRTSSNQPRSPGRPTSSTSLDSSSSYSARSERTLARIAQLSRALSSMELLPEELRLGVLEGIEERLEESLQSRRREVGEVSRPGEGVSASTVSDQEMDE